MKIASIIFLGLCHLSLLSGAQTTYRFTGDGYWSDSANWANRRVPPVILPGGSVIEIEPVNGGECLLNVQQTISKDASLVIGADKKLRIYAQLIQQRDSDDFNLTTADVELLDSSHTFTPLAGQMTGADGYPLGRSTGNTVATGIRTSLIHQLLYQARQWCEEKSTVMHPAGDSTEPPHYGFAFSYGNRSGRKDITARHRPDAGDSLHNAFAVYGTDGNGFLYNLFIHAGISLQPVPTVLGMEQVLNQAFRNDSNFRYLHAVNLGHLPSQALQSGDILLWKTKGHAGLIGKLLNDDLILFNAHGQPKPLTERGWRIKPSDNPPEPGILRTPEEEQMENWGMKRGIHASSFTRLMTDSRWANSYDVLRLKEDSTFQDPRDGQVYTFARIGTQVWMTQNLNYATGNTWFYNNNPANRSIYGLLYDWQTAMTVAPPGWHIPSLSEWNTLINSLGGQAVAGGAMKSNLLWNYPNTGATNSSGFNGLPGGLRISESQQESLGNGGFWWSATEYSVMGQPAMAWYINLANYNARVFNWYEDKSIGFSVRCIRN